MTTQTAQPGGGARPAAPPANTSPSRPAVVPADRAVPEDPAAYRLDRLGAALLIGEALLLMIVVVALLGVVADYSPAVRVVSLLNVGLVGVTTVAAIVAAVVVVLVTAANKSRRARFLAVAIGGGLVFAVPCLVFVVFVLAQAGIAWPGTLLSIPTTFFGLWTFRRMQRNRKPPWLLVLAAFAWGVFVSAYFAQTVEGTLHAIITAEVLPGAAAIISHSAAAAVPEEVGKGAGVVVLVLLAWRRVDGMLGGIVLGACVGLGFQFTESVFYMTRDFDAVLYQHWTRQVTGLLVGHATYTGIIGAGVGLAMRLADWPRRIICVGSGFAVAIAAHLIWDIFAMGQFYWAADDDWLQVFVVQPLNMIVLKGPAFVILLLLVIIALRQETRALHRHLQAEASQPLGAIAPADVPVLVNAPLRFRMRLRALWGGSFAAYGRVRDLHAAQLDLAFARWRREQGEPPAPGVEEALRQRIHRLKAEAA